jgi:DtxR family Mn-dependent transcriptional regulator
MEIKKTATVSQKPLTSTMEDYLEAIVNLKRERGALRVRDIAKRMGVKMPTVSSMLKVLNKAGLVDHKKYEYINLTKKGERIGDEINRRHHALKKFLIDILSIEPVLADQDACKMEHAVSASTMNRIADFMDFIQACPRTGSDWLNHFKEYRLHGMSEDRCREHIRSFSNRLDRNIELIKKE